MYIYAETIKDIVYVWERNESGRVIKTFPAPFYFYAQDPDGEYDSIYGESLAKYEYKTRKEFTKNKQDMLSSGYRLYESDVSPELKILSREYYNKPSPKLNVTFYDIEIDYDEKIGFSSVNNPYAPVSSVALFHDWRNEYVLLVVPPTGEKWTTSSLERELKKYPPMFGENEPDLEIVICENESELLLNFLAEIEDADLISGYNNEFFDDPMIGKRIEITLGEKFLKRLSFKGAKPPRWTEIERMGRKEIGLDIFGRISADYLKLIKKYEVVEKQSYKLEAVAEEKLPHLPKLTYKGNLSRLYKENFPFFCRYNLRDTEILHGFENKMRYVATANDMYHMSTGLFPGVFTTLKLSDLSIINYCHYVMNKIVPDAAEIEGEESIQGAYVLDPKVGMHEHVGAIDVNSLYPSAIRSNNISPETLIGQFVETERAQKEIAAGSDEELVIKIETSGDKVRKTAREWKKILIKNQWSISGYGAIYDQNFEGVIPAVLRTWFEMRKEHKAKKAECEKQIKAIKAKYQCQKK